MVLRNVDQICIPFGAQSLLNMNTFIQNLDAKKRLKFQALMDTLNEAERTRSVLPGVYKESYIHDVQFLLSVIDDLQETVEHYRDIVRQDALYD